MHQSRMLRKLLTVLGATAVMAALLAAAAQAVKS